MMNARKRLLALANALEQARRDEGGEGGGSVGGGSAAGYSAGGGSGVGGAAGGATAYPMAHPALPPLKLPAGPTSRKLARKRRRPGSGKDSRNTREEVNFGRKTPHVLRIGARANADDLRRALAVANDNIEQLKVAVEGDLAWVQENCPVSSLRAQLYCKKHGMKKLQNVMKRIEYSKVIAVFGK